MEAVIIFHCFLFFKQNQSIKHGAYSDKLGHLHFHLVPKYENGFEFGGVFEMNPQKVYLNDAEYAETIEKIVNCL